MNSQKMTTITPKFKLIERCQPYTKALMVRKLQNEGKIVAYSSSLNGDAWPLKAAHIGIGFGISGSEFNKAASDVIILNDSYVSVIQGFRNGRNFVENVQRYIQLQLSFTLISLSIVFIGSTFSVEEPI